MLTISIIVPFYNAEDHIKDCAESLLSQKYPTNDYEIIFVDNNSTDSSIDIVKSYPQIKLLSESKQGSYAARNRGIKEANGQIFAFTDPDCVASPDWLRVVEKAMFNPSTLVVLGQNLMSNNSLHLSMIQDYSNEKNIYTFSSNDGNKYFGHTNNMAVRRDLFNDLGLFIERKRGADTIFVNNVVKKYSPQAVRYSESMTVRHMEIRGLLDYYKKAFTYGRSRIMYKHIANIPPLSYSQRFSIYRNVITKRKYSYPKCLMLFSLLIVGMIYWSFGSIDAMIKREFLKVTHKSLSD